MVAEENCIFGFCLCRSLTLRRHRSRSPTSRCHRRQRSKSISLSPIGKSLISSTGSRERKDDSEMLRKQEEEKKSLVYNSSTTPSMFEQLSASSLLYCKILVYIQATGENSAEMVTDEGAIYLTSNKGYNWRAAVQETVSATLNSSNKLIMTKRLLIWCDLNGPIFYQVI